MAFQTQVYDDGSTLTWDDQTGYRAATPATDYTINAQSASWNARAVQPSANDWGDVLKYGFARLIDAKTRPVQPSNTTPVLVPQTGGFASALTGSAMPWIIAGGVVLALVAFMGSKGA